MQGIRELTSGRNAPWIWSGTLSYAAALLEDERSEAQLCGVCPPRPVEARGLRTQGCTALRGGPWLQAPRCLQRHHTRPLGPQGCPLKTLSAPAIRWEPPLQTLPLPCTEIEGFCKKYVYTKSKKV